MGHWINPKWQIPIGTKFGQLTIIAEAPPERGKRKDNGYNYVRKNYLCKCDCGNEQIVRGNRLRSGKSISCTTCSMKRRPIQVNKRSAIDSLFIAMQKGNTSNRGDRVKWLLNIEEFTNLVNSNCVYCGNPPSKRKIIGKDWGNYNGIDRVDSNKHYTLDNCVACCKTCNVMKMAMSLEDFKAHILKITNFLNLK